MTAFKKTIPTQKVLLFVSIVTPLSAYSQTNIPDLLTLPTEINMSTFLIISGLLVFSILFLFIFQKQANTANKQLRDVTGELDHTREKLAEIRRLSEKTQTTLDDTILHHQNNLEGAPLGIFKLNPKGKCTYLNAQIQKISGLYLKKTQKEGIQSAIHPDDRKKFTEAWDAFIEENTPFNISFRFKQPRKPEVYVNCEITKIFNEKKELENYTGWVSDITHSRKIRLQQDATISHYNRFIEETVDGYYHLEFETPLCLKTSSSEIAKNIFGKMKLISCNEQFAALYGQTPKSLTGKFINTFQDGCGPIENIEFIQEFIESGYKMINIESVHQDPHGNTLNLSNNLIGLIEDDQLVGILGSQKDVTQQKREQEELASKAHFMHQILDSLPADIQVKDTRCRFIYVSQKVAERSGIAQKNWIGKTIFEIIPTTPRDHDKNAIKVMKSTQMIRTESTYKNNEKEGWKETIQVPIISEEGLVEGVIALSLDITDRKKKEEKIQLEAQKLEKNLQERTKELQTSKTEHDKTIATLHETNKSLQGLEEKLKQQQRAEELLQKEKDSLTTQQANLQQDFAEQLEKLNTETDKRKKWEELLSIKEKELLRIEDISADRGKKLEKEITRRENLEEQIKTTQEELKKHQDQLNSITQKHKEEVSTLLDEKQKELYSTQGQYEQAEQQLKKTEELLQKAQNQINELTQKYTLELEKEISQRELATQTLEQNKKELNELKQQFEKRLKQETETLKEKLAEEENREENLIKQEKELKVRLVKLNDKLQKTNIELEQQIKAKADAEKQQNQIENKLKELNEQQEKIIKRETEKLDLNLAENQLHEIKLQRQIKELTQAKAALEEKVRELQGS